ncbi:MAG: hypothetical protein K2X81_29150 [Candidatus Obscuribacterales bacterium]|nr:hypothetical protein [Candidatus Obscuribacterales bacterium]
MGKNYTLVVVDMQPFFTSDLDTLNHVAREIERARERGCDIAILEIPYFSPMDEEGLAPTHKQLRELVKDYARVKTIYKPMFTQSLTHAARCLLTVLLQFGFETRRFRVCGVNTGGWLRTASGDIQVDEKSQEAKHTGCVFDLVLGLSRMAPEAKIKVIADACKDERGFQVNWNDFSELPRVKVLSARDTTKRMAA